jgi:hypothetical protein
VDVAPGSYTGESGATTFTFETPNAQLAVFSDQPLWFTYAQNPVKPWPSNAGSFEQRAETIVGFLKARGLLDFDYTVTPSLRDDARAATVVITPLLDGIPIFEPYPGQPRIWGSVDADGKINQVFYERLALERLQQVALTPAETLWQNFVAGDRSRVSAYLLWNPSTLDRQQARQSRSQPLTVPLNGGVVSRVELVYLTADTSQMSRNALPVDAPARLVIPCWAFSGEIGDGRTFFILLSAMAETSTLTLPTPVK